MRKNREALLIAILAGLVMVGAAAFVVQPVIAGDPQQTVLHVGEAGTFLAPLAVPGIPA